MHPNIKRMIKGMKKKEEALRKPSEERWVLYVLRCRDNTFYTGITKLLERRIKMHNNGKASRYTRSRRPVELIYYEDCVSHVHALIRECAVKALSRGEKERLILGG
jgi:putative endonuclease